MHGVVLVLWRLGTILGNGCGVQGQNYVAMLRESKVSRVSLRELDIYHIIFSVKSGVDTSVA